jgi:hypothetical protein
MSKNLKLTMKAALEFCCKFGLRLLTVDTPSKLQLMQQVDIGKSAPSSNLKIEYGIPAYAFQALILRTSLCIYS